MSDNTDQTPEQQAPNLSVNDLIVLAQVVQAASNRGAIRAEEMSSVGEVYTKLIAFLQASGALKSDTAPEQDNTEE